MKNAIESQRFDNSNIMEQMLSRNGRQHFKDRFESYQISICRKAQKFLKKAMKQQVCLGCGEQLYVRTSEVSLSMHKQKDTYLNDICSSVHLLSFYLMKLKHKVKVPPFSLAERGRKTLRL